MMPGSKLYHCDVFMPSCVDAYCGSLYRLRWTHHAKLECLHDKLGTIEHPPMKIGLQRKLIVEAEVNAGIVVKLVVRIPYEVARDLILVLYTEGPRSDEMTVGTAWTNAADDTHTTLRKAVYSTN